ncbi:hypothetical protein [Streptacidiphilus fuscans]|uniref:Uncharacterized protein n=1 Tax=Streptacidiphilus fuscans TaxID=2789292 RepID=A0A931FF85_9ACTN|nr:hypothetical protein [Streptacidiphilus fuscans]MBF9068179.1 hypothetical protein [Streptacidiphilus fuscans]
MNAPIIRPLAAAHFRDALTAAQSGDLPATLGALLAIDNESWEGIRTRLDELGPTVAALALNTLGGAA